MFAIINTANRMKQSAVNGRYAAQNAQARNDFAKKLMLRGVSSRKWKAAIGRSRAMLGHVRPFKVSANNVGVQFVAFTNDLPD
jgi:hypothetical protein